MKRALLLPEETEGGGRIRRPPRVPTCSTAVTASNACVASTVQIKPSQSNQRAIHVPASARPLGQALNDTSVSQSPTTSAALLSDDVRMNSARSASVSTRTPTKPRPPVVKRRTTNGLGERSRQNDDRDDASRCRAVVGSDIVDHRAIARPRTSTLSIKPALPITDVDDATAVRIGDRRRRAPWCSRGTAPRNSRLSAGFGYMVTICMT